MKILDHVAIRVPCGVCSSEYDVPASVVRDGQTAIAPGCPGCSDYECESRFVATLADPEALEALEAAWARLEASVASHGGSGVTLVALQQRRDDEGRRAGADRARCAAEARAARALCEELF